MRRALLLSFVALVMLAATPSARASHEHSDTAAVPRASSDATSADGGSVVAARKQRSEEGLFEGIPTGTFVVSLILCVLIGAAGGKVYAGIMGPRA